MAHPRQLRSLIFGLSLSAASAVLAIAFVQSLLQPNRRRRLLRADTQHRNVILLVTPMRLRIREVGESRVQIVNQATSKFFGFEPVDVLGYNVMISEPPAAGLTGLRRPTISNGHAQAP